MRMFDTHCDGQWVTVGGSFHGRGNLIVFMFADDGRVRYWTWQEEVKERRLA